ncbi:MAG: ArsR/SmtB family transcription factor [Chloroflexota bacterium]
MDNYQRDAEALTLAAETLKAMAHPVRLCILRGLMQQGACNVTKMQSCLGMPQSTVSQHLAKLRTAGLIAGERQGTEVIYRIKSPIVEEIIRAALRSAQP